MKTNFLILYKILQINQVFSIQKRQAHQLLSTHTRTKRNNDGIFEEIKAPNFDRECHQERCNSQELDEAISHHLVNNVGGVTVKLMDENLEEAAKVSQPIEVTLTNEEDYQNFLINQCKLFQACNKFGTKSCDNSVKSFKCNCLENYSGVLCERGQNFENDENGENNENSCYQDEGKSKDEYICDLQVSIIEQQTGFNYPASTLKYDKRVCQCHECHECQPIKSVRIDKCIEKQNSCKFDEICQTTDYSTGDWQCLSCYEFKNVDENSHFCWLSSHLMRTHATAPWTGERTCKCREIIDRCNDKSGDPRTVCIHSNLLLLLFLIF